MSDFMVILSIPILLVLGVLYVLLGGLLINALKLVYVMLTSKDFVFYTVLGDLSWLFPFKVKFHYLNKM